MTVYQKDAQPTSSNMSALQRLKENQTGQRPFDNNTYEDLRLVLNVVTNAIWMRNVSGALDSALVLLEKEDN
jgi:hypothetical protein